MLNFVERTKYDAISTQIISFNSNSELITKDQYLIEIFRFAKLASVAKEAFSSTIT